MEDETMTYEDIGEFCYVFRQNRKLIRYISHYMRGIQVTIQITCRIFSLEESRQKTWVLCHALCVKK
jgi:hypothetical protein